MELTVKSVSGLKFGNNSFHILTSGFALYAEGKGFVAFESCRTKEGVLAPYQAIGGRKAMASFAQQGLCSTDGISFVSPI